MTEQLEIQKTAAKIAEQTVEISTLPEITLKIVETVQNPKSSANDLHKIVRNDPALSAKILQVVNSAFYGLPGQIGSIDRAIIMLGLNAVKNIAIAASLSKMFKTKIACDDFSGKDLWTHSVAVGTTNKLITKAIGLTLPDEAFLVGLIHDIGQVAIMQTLPQKIPAIMDLRRTGIASWQAEQQVINTDHQGIGMALAAKWKFPRSFQYVTGYHHNPSELAPENRLLTVITYVSDITCKQKGLGLKSFSGDEQVPPELLDEIKLSSEKLQEISEQIDEELESVKSLIS